jgi:lipopolysaccharide exporter
MNSSTGVWLLRARAGLHMLFHPGARLSQRVVHAGFWAFALRFTLRIFTTVRTIILARLLAPADFGLMGIALLMMTMMETLTQTGFHTALVQRQGDIRPYLDTAWTFQVLRGLLLAGVLLLAAPLVAAFFNASEAATIVRVMAIVLVINGFNNIGIIYFAKELEFQKRFMYELANTVPQVAVGIGLALAWQNVWALVYGALAGSAVHLMASYLLHPYRPRPRMEWGKAGELYRYGRWIFLGNIVFFLSNRSDSGVIGRLLGPAALGIYEMGQRFAELATREFVQVSNSVAFPAFSKLQRDQVVMRRAFLLSIDTLAMIVLPISVAMFFMAGPLVSIILGDQWAMVAAVLPALTAAGAVRAIAATGGAMFLGVGRPDLDLKQGLLRMVVILALVYPLVHVWGLAGAGYAVLAAMVLTLPFLFWFSRKLLAVEARHFLTAFFPSLVLCAVVGGGLAAAQNIVNIVNLGSAGNLVVMLALGVLGYAMGALLLWKIAGRGPIVVVRMIRRRVPSF